MFKDKRIQALAISLILCISYFLWIAPLKPIRIANLKIIDTYFALSSKVTSSPKAFEDIVLVTIDDESLRRINIQWPWPRSVIAGIISKISQQGPRLILADLVFAGKSVNPEEDLALINTLKDSKNVIGAAYFGNDGRYVIPDEPIALSLADFGFVNKPRDADNSVRRTRPYFLSPSGEVIDYSLSLKAAGRILNMPTAGLAATLPLSKDGTAYIKFFGRTEKFNIVPVWKIMDSSINTIPLKNKTVLLGVTSESFHDAYSTPLGIMPGLTIDLNEMLTYTNKKFFRYAAGNMNSVIIFLFLLMAVMGALRLHVITGTVFGIALIAASFFLGLFLFTKYIITDTFGAIFLIAASTILLHGARSVLLALENIVLKKEAITDGLTGLFLYRYFELQLKRELKNASSGSKNLALVLYDIDHFKKINDTFGHEFGNTVLRAIARSLKNHTRKNNVIARYGGEEFCIIVTGMGRDHAIKYADRLRNLVGSLEFKTDKGEIIRVAMSAGIAMIGDVPSDNPSEFVKAADCALYRSKNSGRNRISVFDKNLDDINRCG
ncbi:MAG: diguanylate cyclase [Candidatus Omnitrophota bacterium]|nr:diguanylate cyclase [Candidatus Omnitrophota bacterium]